MPTFRSKTGQLQIEDGTASDRRWSVRRGMRVRSAMDGDTDGNRSERSRVRENIRDRFKNENYYGCTIRPAKKKMGLGRVYETGPKSSPEKTRRNGTKMRLKSWAKAPRTKRGWLFSL